MELRSNCSPAAILVARTNSALEVIKTGFEQYVADAARDYGLLYGMATALMALLIGWFASVSLRARLVRQATFRRKRIEPAIAKQICREGERAKQDRQRRHSRTFRPPVNAPKAGNHHPRLICGKTASAHRAAAMRNPRHRMQMAADFAGRAARQVAKRQWIQGQRYR